MRRARRLQAVATLLVLFPLAGCDQSRQVDSIRLDQTAISFDDGLKLADALTAKTLAKESQSTDPNRRPVAPDGRVLTLDDYERTVSLQTLDDRPTMLVLYECRVPLDYLGGWTHFSVWVYLDTGETRWLGGM
ncbi:MAG: hypothetical protein WBF17_12185 [Phycisphaerae bacterium]